LIRVGYTNTVPAGDNSLEQHVFVDEDTFVLNGKNPPVITLLPS